MEQVYAQAVAEGADFVVGPLEKQAVEELAKLTDLPVPVLALNQTQAGPSEKPAAVAVGVNAASRSSYQVIKRAVAVQAQIAPLQDMGLVRRQRDSEVARLPGDFRAGDSVQAL